MALCVIQDVKNLEFIQVNNVARLNQVHICATPIKLFQSDQPTCLAEPREKI